MSVIITNTQEKLRSMGADVFSDCDCGGGYKDCEEIYIDENLNFREQRLAVIHEVLDGYLRGRVKHSKIDKIACDVIEYWLAWREAYFQKAEHYPD